MSSSPQLAVVIVSWNVRDLLRRCLASVMSDWGLVIREWDRSPNHQSLIPNHTALEVFVVDNASTDGTPEMVRREFPSVRLIASKENLGFAAGNNLALRQISNLQSPNPKYIWLLNPDTEVLPGATAALIAALDSHPRAGVAGARLLYPDGSLQHSAFRFPGLVQLMFEFLPFPARLYDTALNGRYPRRLYEGEMPFSVDHPLGAAMMVRMEAIAQVGLLDGGFWMYCEEIDWCWRMRKAGWRALCVPIAQVVHHAARSSEQVRAAAFVALWRSRLRLYDKHYPPAKRRLARGLVRAGMRRGIREARAAHSRGEIDAAELAARVEACQAVVNL
jgi:GT2 family glycosyltransferase